MKSAFFQTLAEIAAQDSRVMLITGDLGFGVVEPFAARFPDRFLNIGVSEQNLAGVAAGMALSGKVVFAYSIGNFPTLRCLEQIRNDICYHRANVKIVASGGGLTYGSLGMSHHATEDLAIMRVLPEMVVEAPGDPVEARAATRALATLEGPAYLRLDRHSQQVHREATRYEIGRAIRVREGNDLTLISTGSMLPTAVQVADRLHVGGISAAVLSMHTVKPLDTDAVLDAARQTAVIFTLEEHSVVGGLGGAVAETLAESMPGHVFFRRLGLPPMFVSIAGSQEFLRSRYGLSAEAVLASITGVLATTASR